MDTHQVSWFPWTGKTCTLSASSSRRQTSNSSGSALSVRSPVTNAKRMSSAATSELTLAIASRTLMFEYESVPSYLHDHMIREAVQRDSLEKTGRG